MAGTNTITVYRGEDVTLAFTMDPVVDISGWTLEFNVEASGGQAITKAGAIVSGPAGTLTVALTDTDTNIRVGTYQYDLWRTDAGSERVLAVGSFIVTDVARHPAV